MSDSPLDTLRLHEYVDRWQSGDRNAADQLLTSCQARLDRLSRNMLRSFPNVRDWTDAEDVLQGSLMRLLRSLRTITPKSMRCFYNLAAVHIRRELLDLARHYRRDQALVPLDPHAGTDSNADNGPQVASPPLPDDFDLWCKFHEAVDDLDDEEREVIGLIFYHGWKHKEIATLFKVDERTIRRRWSSACMKLRNSVDEYASHSKG